MQRQRRGPLVTQPPADRQVFQVTGPRLLLIPLCSQHNAQVVQRGGNALWSAHSPQKRQHLLVGMTGQVILALLYLNVSGQVLSPCPANAIFWLLARQRSRFSSKFKTSARQPGPRRNLPFCRGILSSSPICWRRLLNNTRKFPWACGVGRSSHSRSARCSRS